TLRSPVRAGGKVVDEYETPFGIREVVFDADRGFLLNGRHVKLNGVCLHHDGGAVGAAVPERVWERRLQLLQEMGCNAIRTSHNPYSPNFSICATRWDSSSWMKSSMNGEFRKVRSDRTDTASTSTSGMNAT